MFLPGAWRDNLGHTSYQKAPFLFLLYHDDVVPTLFTSDLMPHIVSSTRSCTSALVSFLPFGRASVVWSHQDSEYKLDKFNRPIWPGEMTTTSIVVAALSLWRASFLLGIFLPLFSLSSSLCFSSCFGLKKANPADGQRWNDSITHIIYYVYNNKK